MYVILKSSTYFEHQHAHLQEDKLYYHSTHTQFVLLKIDMLISKHVEDCNITYILLMNKRIVY
jgi:hypothetical protein